MIDFGPFDSFLFILMIHFGPFGSATKFSLFYFILLILDDFSTFCPLILVHLTHFDDNFTSFESFS